MEPRYPIPTVGALVKGPSGRVLDRQDPQVAGFVGGTGGQD
ncbi:MAG: hypothetical protein KatS3mg072_1972 [Meiothermus sp.]|nr:MAG: hypothetical protein KatS3mg072_1972 [Meiothermus sp.]